jgi:hypothetical protein
MIRRPAVTLMEVLIAMFIMAIGMMALLVLFPVGAVSMAQALKDDRCAYTASMAENVAIAMNVRHDPNVNAAFLNVNPGYGAPTSNLVYVDPYGAIGLPAVPPLVPFGLPLGQLPGISPGIPRVYPSFATTTVPLADRWFSLPDDLSYTLSGTVDTSTTGGIIDRGRRYSYAYLLRQLPTSTTGLIQLYVVVYSGRPVNSLTPETTIPATLIGQPMLGAAGTNFLTLPAGTTVKRGGWVLDTTYNLPSGSVNGYFYRVTNISEIGGFATVELQTNLIANVTQVTIMDNVAEVFDKGTTWRP